MGQENDQGDQIQDAHHHTRDRQELERSKEKRDESVERREREREREMTKFNEMIEWKRISMIEKEENAFQ